MNGRYCRGKECPLARSEKTRGRTRQNSKFLTAIAAGRGHETPSLCVRFGFSFEDGGDEGERGWDTVDGESSGTWGPRRLTCATWLASRSKVMEFDCSEADKIGGETPYSRRALTSRFLQGHAPGAVISALCSRAQYLRGVIVLELAKTRAGEVDDGCSDEVRGQWRPRGKVSRGSGGGRLPPPPLFRTFTGQ